MKSEFDIIIGGAGIAGMTMALACERAGFRTALVDRVDPAEPDSLKRDCRASAISATNMTLFKNLGVQTDIEPHCQAMSQILISEGQIGDISPITLGFDTTDRPDLCAYMVENRHIRRALIRQIKNSKRITLVAPFSITKCEREAESAKLYDDTGAVLEASLIIAADGRNSPLRQDAGITVSGWPYKQKALTTIISHEKSHDSVAHEIFFPQGPFAILPLSGQRSHIVWSDNPDAIDAAMSLSDDAFLSEVERRVGDSHGQLSLEAPRQSFPLSLQMAENYTGSRLALIGDAAHAIHPIAGQGLNMGLRDVAALAEILGNARSVGLDIGGAVLSDFETWRRSDNQLVAASTDIFNRLFSNRSKPLKHLRRVGLALINRNSPLQQFFMSEAAGKSGNLPPLLRI